MLITTLNQVDLPDDALESLSQQTFTASEFEIAIIDDGSSDSSGTVVMGYSGGLAIRYLYQRNAGLVSARNHGIIASQGNILLFLMI